MRFAYIDSQGNEVSIPSIDALALRIELGAIGPDTQLYDEAADRWGPASSHEIFHTLSRQVGEEGGFVAPPPPVAPPPEMPAPAPAAGKPEEGRRGPAAKEEAPPPALPAEADVGFEFTLTEPVTPAPAPAPAPAPPAPAPESPAPVDLGEWTLAEAAPPAAKAEPPATPPAEAPKAPPAQDAPFDFGSFGVLDLEAPLAGAEPEAGVPAEASPVQDDFMDFTPGAGIGDEADFGAPVAGPGERQPPAWMEQDGPPSDGAMDLGAPPAAHREAPARPTRQGGDDDGSPRRERPTPRSRPSPPRRPRRNFPTGLILGLVGVAAVGGGGYYVWSNYLSGPGAVEPAAPEVVALPQVVIPDIPADLLPRMREVGDAALDGTLERMRRMASEMDLAVEPRGDWLAGVYLANASQYRDIQEYWEGIESFVDRARGEDTRIFHEEYAARLQEEGIEGDTARILLERADSGFLAVREDRFEAYAKMDDLVIAALDLHQFLLLNEQDIDYDPAAGGVSRDPVLEAVPKTTELGDRMWEMVGRITGALDALGTLDKVTTERITGVLLDRIRQAGFR